MQLLCTAMLLMNTRDFMFQVKICGVTSVEDAMMIADSGADAIGLNFITGSPRCLDLKRATEISKTYLRVLFGLVFS
jgi:phosphoribosylanthranilate isomerase